MQFEVWEDEMDMLKQDIATNFVNSTVAALPLAKIA